MRIVFFTFYYPPDLSAGSFRAVSIAKALSKKLSVNDEIHIITSHPNRYASFHAKIEDIDTDSNIMIHRIHTPKHKGSISSQIFSYTVFAFSAFKLGRKLKPNFLIVTTGRLMSSILTLIVARIIRRNFFVDMRDIFSESISDLLVKRNKLLGSIVKSLFIFLEKQVFKSASGVNMVSEGFIEYFHEVGIDTSKWSFFTNGVDEDFLNLPIVTKPPNKKIKTILYAGNIGSGQGLESIIPATAKYLGDEYRFVIIGDGNRVSFLRNEINSQNVSNIELLAPIKRIDLIQYYFQADILFVHLNDYPAFRRVLPSKIFEYAAFGKPIVAGLNGYPAKFTKEHIPQAVIFDSCDSLGASLAIKKASNLVISKKVSDNFVNMFSRVTIMDRMASHIIDIINNK